MPKGEKAQQQKAGAAAAKEAAAAAAAEAAEAAKWSDGKLDKKAAKAAEAERAAQEKAAKKAADAAQLRKEEEEAANGRKLRGGDKVAARKAQSADEEAEGRKRASAKAIEARSIDDAIAALSIAASGEDGPPGAGGGGGGGKGLAEAVALAEAAEDAHPERRMKAGFKRFQERELPILKEENPGLKLSQLMERLHEKWEKSPENPVRAAMLAAQQNASAWKEK